MHRRADERDRARAMAPPRGRGKRYTAVFFAATLVLWGVSVAFVMFINGRSEFAPVVASFFFFQAANWAVRLYFRRNPLFVNTVISLIHSTITSASVVLILTNQWIVKGLGEMFEHEQLVSSTWKGGFSALCFSCGYFAYDQLDILRHHLSISWIPRVLAHHLILLVSFTLALYWNVGINCLILFLICELHSIILHLRRVRTMDGLPDVNSWMVKVEWVLNWTTFFITRLGCHILITYKLMADASKFEKRIELLLVLFGMACVDFVNVIFGLEIHKIYQLEKNQQRHQE